ETRPFLPSAATRTASSVCSSIASAIASRNSASSFSRSGVCSVSVIDLLKLRCSARRRYPRGSEGTEVSDRRSALTPREAPAHEGGAPTGVPALNGQVKRGCSGESGPRLFDQGLEGLGLVDGEIGEHLAVHLDASLAEAVDKSTIGQAVLAGRGIDALDPERTEITLPGTTVTIEIGRAHV